MKTPEYDETNKQEDVRHHFDQRSHYWQSVYSATTFPAYALQKRKDCVLGLCRKTPKGGRILDVGCGAGGFVHQLAREGYQAVGLDIAPQMIETAKREALNQNLSCAFEVGNVNKLLFAQGTWDTVIAVGLLEYISDDQNALSEILRVLNPQGRLIITMPNALDFYRIVAFPRSLPMVLGPDFKRFARKLQNRLLSALGLPFKDMSSMWLGRAVIPSMFKRHLEKAGFKHLETIPLVFGPFHPFGMPLSENQDIQRSEELQKLLEVQKWFAWGASLFVFEFCKTACPVSSRRSEEDKNPLSL